MNLPLTFTRDVRRYVASHVRWGYLIVIGSDL